MKISVNWLKEFTDIKIPVDELVKKIGAQLGEVEEVVDLGKRYEGIVVAKVVACAKHPAADKLSVCKIDDGGVVKHVKRDDDGLVQVVCGAPNVREGLSVAWIPPGAIVPSTYDQEQFKLEARELRGLISNGMIASGHELAINDDHDVILEIDKNAEPGTPLADVYGLKDYIIDIENKMFTHRPDCFGILGVAREIAGIQHKEFTSPDWYKKALDIFDVKGEHLKLDVKNEVPELVPRFMMLPISGVSVKSSPITMQSYLSRVGIKPINNVVDVTNFIMALTAQPMHAFDYDKVAAADNSTEASIVVRKPKPNEEITLLGGKTIKPHKDAIMITSEKCPIAIGGVMGGADTEVDGNTRNIILEVATFDMYSIRRTSMEHGLFTDAVTRFNKGQSPLQNERAMAYAIFWLQELASASVAGKVHDLQGKGLPKPNAIHVSPKFVNDRLGSELSVSDMAGFLKNVEFEVSVGEGLGVRAPFWRTDIEIPEDIVEEVGRLYGYDHLPLELPKRTISPAPKDELLVLKNKIRDILSDAGANEVLTYNFVHSELIDRVGQNREDAFQLSNALSPELQYFRMSLIPSLLDKIHSNIKAGHGEFAIFEINQTHDKNLIDKDDLPIEEYRLGFVFAADEKTAGAKYSGAAYYQAKYYLRHLLRNLGIKAEYQPIDHEPHHPTGKQALAPFERNRTSYVKSSDGKLIAELGEFRPSVRKNLKLPQFIAGFEVDVLQLLRLQKQPTYKPLSKFPSTEQDISFKIASNTSYEQLRTTIKSQLEVAKKEHGYKSCAKPIDIYQAKDDVLHKHVTMRIKLTHQERTLTTDEVNKLLDSIAKEAHAKLKATRL